MKKIILLQSSKEDLGYVGEIFSGIAFEASKNKMCSQSVSDLEDQISKGEAIIASCEVEWAGYIYIQTWKSCSEICGVIVKPEFRQQGLGTSLAKACLELALAKFPNKPVIGLSNEISHKICQKIGFKKQDKENFDPEIFELCSQCEEHDNFPDCHCIGMIYQKI